MIHRALNLRAELFMFRGTYDISISDRLCKFMYIFHFNILLFLLFPVSLKCFIFKLFRIKLIKLQIYVICYILCIHITYNKHFLLDKKMIKLSLERKYEILYFYN